MALVFILIMTIIAYVISGMAEAMCDLGGYKVFRSYFVIAIFTVLFISGVAQAQKENATFKVILIVRP